MAFTLSRRHLLHGTAAVAASGFLPRGIGSAVAQTATQLSVVTRTLDVKGKPATVFGVVQGNGLSGVFLDPGQRFTVDLANRLTEDTIVHWHGQTPPVAEDGVSITGEEKLIGAGTTRRYDYAPRPGTYWMHSHQGLQELELLAAPLIVRSADDLKQDAQEVTVMLHDFTFKSPEEVMKEVASRMPGMAGGMPMSGSMKDMPGMSGGGMKDTPGMKMVDVGKPDLNDYDFDAYLANDRTLDDPMVVRTERNGRVRLRIINGGSATIFWIELGGADGTLVGVDGEQVRPMRGRRFPIAEAQRLDIVVDVPAGKVVPVLAQREGDRIRTGIILAAPGAAIAKIPEMAAKEAEPMGFSLEERLVAIAQLAERRVDREIPVVLSGGMNPYKWFINGRGWEDRQPLRVAKGQRVVFDFVNQTPMGHPMHLHGHAFQVVSLNGKALRGALRDTVQVPAKSSVKIAFDADNPGRWVMHCHNLLHMESGMITEVVYDT